MKCNLALRLGIDQPRAEPIAPGHGLVSNRPRSRPDAPRKGNHLSNAQLETAIDAAWEARDQITAATTGETRDAIEDTKVRKNAF